MANKAVNDAVHKLQLALLDGVESDKQLLAAGSLISRSDYDDVVTERSIANLCGYPLCPNPLLPSNSQQRKGRYRISLKEHKVYDAQDMYLYCSTNCLVNSKVFKGSLKEERCVVVNEKRIEEILGLFDGSKGKEEDVESKIVGLFDRLTVKENENVERNLGDVVGGAGPSDAIEGYVPQRRAEIEKKKKKGVNAKTNMPNSKNDLLFSGMDFKSTIITNDEYSISKSPGDTTEMSSNSKFEEPKGKKGINAKTNKTNKKKDLFFSEMDFMSTIITNDEYSISKTPNGSTETASNLKFEEPKEKEGGKNLEDQCYTSRLLTPTKEDSCVTSGDLTGKSKIIAKDEVGAQEFPLASVPPQIISNISTVAAEKESHVEKGSVVGVTMPKSSLRSPGSRKLGCSVTWADEKIDSSGSRNLCELRDMDDDGNNDSTVAAEMKSHVEKGSISGGTMPKSSLKSSGSKKLGWSVTWADEKSDSSGSRNHYEVRDMDYDVTWADEQSDSSGIRTHYEVRDMDDDGNGDGMFRVASAEACSMALSKAAEAVASGDSGVADAVSEAGIIILPHPHDVKELESTEDTDALEPEAVTLKWPSKPGIPRSDLFDPEDSWYDSPPEGFSLTLSPFATMWNAIFSWITSSSLAYIYGRDESFHDEYLSVNGREYPQKIVLGDGRSSEIMQTLSSCLARTYPGLVADLRLSTPVSTLEKGVERFLSTMSFVDPLPAFRMKQWQVIALLFIDALSVCRIPALTPHMTNRMMLIRKVLDSAQISAEEYEVMKDFIIPLGRAPQFSIQSGA